MAAEAVDGRCITRSTRRGRGPEEMNRQTNKFDHFQANITYQMPTEIR